MSKKVIDDVTNIINEYISFMYSLNPHNSKNLRNNILENNINSLLNDNTVKYKIETSSDDNYKNKKISEFVEKLSNTNEISDSRRTKGVYYTPADVTEYIIINSFINYLNPATKKMFNVEEGYHEIIKFSRTNIKELIYNATVFDPTCGTGEFLVSTFDVKINILKKMKEHITYRDVLDIVNTLFGNDIDDYSTDISKFRLFIKASEYVELDKLDEFVIILKKNFSNIDFVHEEDTNDIRHTFILGNPPYVEYSQMKTKPKNNFGNIYADVMKNSVDLLNDKGVMSFVIPISYISTPRMNRIRRIMENNLNKQILLNFADRPDSLFTGAHQKLSIFFGIKNNYMNKNSHKTLYSSSYKHWYKSERKSLFENIEISKIDKLSEKFYPKIGNNIEKSIFNKVFTTKENSLFNKLNKLNKNVETEKIYLNMRATFYIKSFSFNPGTSEYKSYDILKKDKGFILSLLNSSLFFLYWSIISDCWHITQKELKHFYIPDIVAEKSNFRLFDDLSLSLETRLEETKSYIGTKQVDYAYKHKEAIDIIDKIDDELAILYKLNSSEVNYVKNFSRKYRLGIDDEKSN